MSEQVFPPSIPYTSMPMRPDPATVVVLASDIDQHALSVEVERFPGVRLVHTTINADAFSELKPAFNDRAPKQ